MFVVVFFLINDYVIYSRDYLVQHYLILDLSS